MREWFKPPFKLAFVWATLPFALVLFGFGVQPLKSWDYWWHIAMGRLIAATGWMPMENLFLYTLPADNPGYVQPWIAQFLLFQIHDFGGLQAVLLLRNFLAAFAFGGIALWAGKRANSIMTGAILALVFASFGFFTIAARSHLLAWPIFLMILPVAYGLRSERLVSKAWLGVFVLASFVWANLHGTFVIPAVVCFAFAAADFLDERTRRVRRGPHWLIWGITGLVGLGATLLNPRGWENYAYLWMLSTNAELRQTVTEWWPTTPLFPEFFGGLFWVTLIACLVVFWRRRADLDYADFFMVLWIAVLTIPQTRFMLWFGLTAPIAIARYVPRIGEEDVDEPSTLQQGIHVVVAVGAIVMALAVQPWTDANPIAADVQAAPTRTAPPLAGLVQAEAPIEPAKMVRERFDKPPRIFHDHRYPGFLMWWIDDETPDQLVFVDNRIEMPTPQMWREFDAIGRGELGTEPLERWEVEVVITGWDTQPGLIELLKKSPTWDCPFDNELYVYCERKPHRP